MIQWRPFAPWLTAALAILLGAYFQHNHNEQLAAARQQTYDAVAAYKTARTEALGYAVAALEANQRADSIEHARTTAAPRVAAIVKAAPDTCKPVIAALQGENQQLKDELASRKDAFTEQKQATAVLAPAADHVAEAATHLADKSKTSFWSKLKPEVGVGAYVGIDPTHPERGVEKGVGVTVSWKVI